MDKLEIIKLEISILETGFAGVVNGSLVDMRNYADLKTTDKNGLIEKSDIDNFLIPLKLELEELTNNSLKNK